MGHESSGYTPIAGMHNRTQPKERPPAIQATYGGGPPKNIVKVEGASLKGNPK